MSTNEHVNIEELINTETEKRIEEMGKQDYEFPPRITRVDITAAIVGVAGSLVLILLCMIGVIQ